MEKTRSRTTLPSAVAVGAMNKIIDLTPPGSLQRYGFFNGNLHAFIDAEIKNSQTHVFCIAQAPKGSSPYEGWHINIYGAIKDFMSKENSEVSDCMIGIVRLNQHHSVIELYSGQNAPPSAEKWAATTVLLRKSLGEQLKGWSVYRYKSDEHALSFIPRRPDILVESI